MPIQYACACGETIVTRDERAGKLEKCPACRMTVQVPDASPPEPPKAQGLTSFLQRLPRVG